MDIEKAFNAIKPYIHQTPLIFSNYLSRLAGGEVYLKCENLQETGSFKVKGAFNKILSIGKDRLNGYKIPDPGRRHRGLKCRRKGPAHPA
ncbi:MAG: pyridoxal-phosphate dependent enzyme [Nitrospiraceae bacterium]|nr:pyridoxal-phosphate dependent enzyme [Nitrospiraceae bacterium]